MQKFCLHFTKTYIFFHNCEEICCKQCKRIHFSDKFDFKRSDEDIESTFTDNTRNVFKLLCLG